MLEKLQSLAMKFDKKRAYTALGALVVALATGHAMQRLVGPAGLVATQPVQQAAVATPKFLAPAATAPTVAEVAPDLPALADVAATPDRTPEEVTKADNLPAREPLAVLSAPEGPAPVGAGPDTAPETLPEMAAEPMVAEEPQIQAATDALPAAGGADDVAMQLADAGQAAGGDELPMPALDMPVFDLAPAAPAPVPAETGPLAGTCEVDFSAAPMPGALLALEYSAPCAAGAEVAFDHAGLRFTELLDDAGNLSVLLPAMAAEAEVTATLLPDGAVARAQASVPDMAGYHRVSLVWKGGTGLQLHALESGASYGEPGHIWAETPGLPARASLGEGGYLTVLGATAGGYAADVYTFPASLPAAPAISIEAQVLDTTCGMPIAGTYLRARPDGAPEVTELGMVVPGCEAVGEYLVLKNLPQDLTIAGQ